MTTTTTVPRMEEAHYSLTFLRPSLFTRAAPMKTPGRAIAPSINWYSAVFLIKAGPETPLRILAIMVDETDKADLARVLRFQESSLTDSVGEDHDII